ncbi:MAG TPA: response regulator [Clostridia bacterium]|nr:response regulator [Clostridia bacterium]
MYKLLIVEDEPLIRKGISKLIDHEELAVGSVFEAADGIFALKIVKSEKPDIVLTDINMPGMDGLEFAKKARELSPGIKIAVITGYDYFDYAVTALKTGVDDYVLKPVSREDITNIIKKLITRIKAERVESEVRKTYERLAEIKNPDDEGTDYRKEIRAVMDKRFNEPEFSLKELAKEVALSPGYLSTLFKDIFGITFHDYLTAERLERAKILLLSTGLKNYEVAEQVGFPDPNYFSTAFKKRFGMSPSHYRSSAGGDK